MVYLSGSAIGKPGEWQLNAVAGMTWHGASLTVDQEARDDAASDAGELMGHAEVVAG